ncbi:MAG: DegV family protein [Clostridiaceae bacterium]|jgi:DegV family protein with EDD domain|nr:DegV family protein [Clostridiaceae bacterium]
MREFEIVTDSCCDLPVTYVNEKKISIVNLTCIFNGMEYIDDLGKSLSFKDFYDGMENGIVPKTSQPSTDAFYTLFKKLVNENKDILYLCVSSGLSGTINSANIAKDMILEENKEANIYILDVLTASLGLGLCVVKAIDLKESGKSMDEIINFLEGCRQNINTYITVNDLIYLKRGGRISSAAAMFGMVLHIKPILTLNHEGRVIPVLKVRGRKKAIDKIFELVVERIIEPEDQTIFISHGNCLDEAIRLKERIENKVKVKNFLISDIGPVVGTYGGPGAMAVFFIGKGRQHHIIEQL